MGKYWSIKIPSLLRQGLPGAPCFLALTTALRIEQNSHGLFRQFSKLSHWFYDPHPEGQCKDKYPPSPRSTKGSQHSSPPSADIDRSVILMTKVESVGAASSSQQNHRAWPLTALCTLPCLPPVILFLEPLLPSNRPFALPLTPPALLSRWDSAPLECQFPTNPVTWSLLPFTEHTQTFFETKENMKEQQKNFLLVLPAFHPIELFPLFPSPAGMLPLPRSLFLILHWNETFSGTLTMCST